MAFWWISITSRERRQSVDYLNFSLCDWCWLLLAIVGNVSQGLFIIIIIISLCARYRRPLNRPARTHNICPRTKSCATGTPFFFYIFIYHFIIIIGRSSFLLADRWVTDACLVCALSLNFLFFCRGLDRPVPRHYHWSGAEVSQTLFIFIIKFSFNLSIELEITAVARTVPYRSHAEVDKGLLRTLNTELCMKWITQKPPIVSFFFSLEGAVALEVSA